MNISKNKIFILPNTTLYYPNELLHTLHTHCSQGSCSSCDQG
jgi:hypothetical protein